MNIMELRYFKKLEADPFFIQYGHHEDELESHTHADFYELVIVLSGTAHHMVGDEEFFIKKGDVFVVGEHIAHGYKDPHDFEICNIMFSKDRVFENAKDIRKIVGYHALFVLEPYLANTHKFTNRLLLSPSEYQFVRQSIDEMIREYDSTNPGRLDALQSYFILLSVYLSRRYRMESVNLNQGLINIASSVSYMENHFTEALSIEELADISGMSKRHFTRLFNVTYGVSPGAYLLNLRLDMARGLLRDSQRSVTEIAYLSGFADSNYFSRIFSKNHGLTPKAYRVNYQTKALK